MNVQCLNVRYYAPKGEKMRLQMCSVTGWADVPEVREKDELGLELEKVSADASASRGEEKEK